MIAKGSVLITGGAGYIRSHAVLVFQEAGYSVVVLDDLSTGMRDNVSGHIPFVRGDGANMDLVETIVRNYGICHVIHFAGSVVVPESVADPLAYYRNNTAASRNLFQAAVRTGVRNIIFSSTAAVYGEPEVVPVPETAKTDPANPYGRSKLMTEWMLADAAAAHDLRYVALRYFNVAGADPQGRTGQSTPPATHLIKMACEAAVGVRPFVQVFGTDYPTADGTGVRDYIHVDDLVAAHVCALHHLEKGGGNVVLNCGYGRGFSVKSILETVQRIAGRRLDVCQASRRPGNPARWSPLRAGCATFFRGSPVGQPRDHRSDRPGLGEKAPLSCCRRFVSALPCRRPALKVEDRA